MLLSAKNNEKDRAFVSLIEGILINEEADE